MKKTRSAATCEDCFFRREGLCALPGNEPCPTFRAASVGALEPPKQARLVPLPLATPVAVVSAA
jgi:hypothetical protein